MTPPPVRRTRRRRMPMVLQATLTDCAPACLAMVLAAHGRPRGLADLRAELGSGRDGVSAAAIRDVAVESGLICRSLRVEASALARLPAPFVAHWGGHHFVVVQRVGRRRIIVADPALGRRRLDHATFAANHTGVVQLFAPTDAPPVDARGRAAVVPVIGPAILGELRALGVLITTSLLLLGLGIAVPFLTSFLVAGMSAGGRLSGVSLVVAGCVALAAAVGGINLLRGFAAAQAQRGIGRTLTGSLVDRLLAAPLTFFEHRGRGDVISRVTASESVRDAVATHLVATVLDAVAAVGYTVIVFVLDPRLGLVTALLSTTQVVVFAALAGRLQRLRREELLAEAYCHSWLMETVSGIAWLKAAGAETQAREHWSDLSEKRLGLLVRSGRTGAVADALAAAMRTVGPLVLLLVAGLALIGADPAPDAGEVGRAVGLAALATAALVPFSSLAATLRALQELRSVTSHLDDLASAPDEQPESRPPAPALTGALEAAGLRFRHHRRAPWVVDGVDLSIRPGQKVAVVGPSGSGKSTLARLLIGLYAPTEGNVRVDGRSMAELDLASVRRQVGLVLQEPFLITGSITENIALRHPGATAEQIAEAARLAEIDDDIRQMPAGYDTLLTEGGVGLSGGQRQRIALARALLGKPQLLVLDEATSHVDQLTEARIEDNLRGLGITQIVIAHRLSTVRDANRIVVLQHGRIVEQGDHDRLIGSAGAYARLVEASRPTLTAA